MPLCKKCGAPIIWNHQDHEETGKWRPFDEEADEPHDCPESDWNSGSGGSGSWNKGGSDTSETLIKIEDKIDNLSRHMLKLFSELQTLRLRIEGQMPLFTSTSHITAKPVNEPILDPADLTEED